MSNTITQAFVQQFDATIRLQAQQKTSRLQMATTDRGDITGESFTANRLAALEDTPQKLIRHGDTQWSESTHSTRVAIMQDFYQALPVDRNDEPKLLANPSGAYMDALIAAWNRRQDAVIYNALIGNAQAKDGSLTAMPSGQTILHGSAGMTKAKLIQTRKLFRKNESDDVVGEELFFTFNSEMLEDVLSDTTLTSSDWMAVKMLQEGDLSGKWLGFNWVPYERLSFSTYYTAVAWAKSAIHFGRGYFEGKSQRRGDKQDTLQVSAAGSIGAVRVEEEKVVLVQFQ